MGSKPIILDVDPGHDDAVALMLACGHPDLDLLAVTTVAGNVTIEKTTRNALRVLALVGRHDVPVGVGASGPLKRPLHTAEDIHGESGLDGPEELPDADFGPDERDAVELISETLRASREPVTLVPVGPLTNIALLLREHPDLKDRIARISLMGGSIGLGNTTPAAEFNIYVDPEAASEVFESGLPITMSGLDVTHLADVGPEERELLRTTGRVGGVVAGFLDYFAANYRNTFGFDDLAAARPRRRRRRPRDRPLEDAPDASGRRVHERPHPRQDRLRLLRCDGQETQRRRRGRARPGGFLQAPIRGTGPAVGAGLKRPYS